MGWWDDDIRDEVGQGVEDIFNQAIERSLGDLKVNKVCMLVFNIIKSCHMVAGNKDHHFYFEKHDQRKWISSYEIISERHESE